MRNRTILAVLVVSLLSGLSPLSADPVIQRGIDVFSTLGNGKTFYDFSQNPIPAGFFCKNSKAFTGRVAFKGLPLAADPPGQLRSIDTVVERLDNAVFDDKGIATTRVRLRALSLVSITPVKTACGAFHLYLSLNGKQKVTTMTILRTQERGGDFLAPLAVDVKMTFIPVKPMRNQGARKLELTGSVTFPVLPIPWSLMQGAPRRAVAVSVDTDGDLTPDTLLPGTSNFMAGQSPDRAMSNSATSAAAPRSTATPTMARRTATSSRCAPISQAAARQSGGTGSAFLGAPAPRRRFRSSGPVSPNTSQAECSIDISL